MSPPLESVKIALDWIAGDDVWRESDVHDQVRRLGESLRQQGIRVELVRGHPVAASSYDPRQGRTAPEFSVPSLAGPVLLSQLEVLNQANLIAQRPGFLRALVAPRRIRQARQTGLTPDAPLSVLESAVARFEVFGPALPMPLPDEDVDAAFQSDAIPPTGTRRATVETRSGWQSRARSPGSARSALSPVFGSPPAYLSAPTGVATPVPARPRETVRIAIDWVDGADPWRQPDVIERARESARALATRGLRVEIVRGRAVPAQRYDVSQARSAASLSVPGPTGAVILDQLDVLDHSILIAQHPGSLHVLIAPPVSGGSRLITQPNGEPRWAEPVIGNLAAGPALTFALPEAMADSESTWAVPPPAREPGADGHERGAKPTPTPARPRRASRVEAVRRPANRPERVQIVLDWVAEQDPWQRETIPALAPEAVRRLASQGVRVEIVRGREVPTTLYQEASAQAESALTVQGPRGMVSLEGVGLPEGALAIARRPGHLRLIVGQPPRIFNPVGSSSMPLPLPPVIGVVPTRSESATLAAPSAGPEVASGAGLRGATTLGSSWHQTRWRGVSTMSAPSIGVSPAFAGTATATARPAARAAIGSSPRGRGGPAASSPTSIGTRAIQRLSAPRFALGVRPFFETESLSAAGSVADVTNAPYSPLPLGERGSESVPTRYPAPGDALGLSLSQGGRDLASETLLGRSPVGPATARLSAEVPTPMNVLVFDVTRTEPGAPPSLATFPSVTPRPDVGAAITHLESGRRPSVAPSAVPAPPMPRLIFASESAPEALPLRTRDVARAASSRPTVSPGQSTPMTITSADAGSPPGEPPKPPDMDLLARQIYAMVKQRLAIERERLGRPRGFRTW